MNLVVLVSLIAVSLIALTLASTLYFVRGDGPDGTSEPARHDGSDGGRAEPLPGMQAENGLSHQQGVTRGSEGRVEVEAPGSESATAERSGDENLTVRDGTLYVGSVPFDAIALNRLPLDQAPQLDSAILKYQQEAFRAMRRKVYPEQVVIFNEQFFASGAHLREDTIYTAVMTDKPQERYPDRPSFGYLAVAEESYHDAYVTRDARRRLLTESALREEREQELAKVVEKLSDGELTGRLEFTEDLQYIYVMGDDGQPAMMSSHMLFP